MPSEGITSVLFWLLMPFPVPIASASVSVCPRPMRTPIKFLSLVVVCLLAVTLGSTAAFAQMTARIVKINGDARQATVTNPGAAPTTVVASLIILEGASIETRAGVELFVETFPGAVATIRENSLVRLNSLRLVSAGVDAGKRAAELELQRGSVISTLDPSKQAITKYGIKTPRGVAAARGTVYGVSVIPAAGGGGSSSALVLSGTVVIDRGPGEPPITIPFGQGAVDNDDEASLLRALIARSPSLAADVLAAVGIVAANVAFATSAAGSPDSAARLLTSVTSAAVGALPGQAPAIVQIVMGAIVAPGSAIGSNPQTVLGAISAVTDAAVRAVIAAGGGLSQAGAAARAAGHGVVQGYMTNAMDAARAANPGISPAALLAAANQAAGGESVTGALGVIGNVATGTAVRMLGQSGDAGGASATGAGIGQAASAGASDGALAALAGAGVPNPGEFTPPIVNVQVRTVQPLGVTTISALIAGTTSSSSWTGTGADSVTTQTSGPGGQTTTVVPAIFAPKPAAGVSGSGAPPAKPIVTPLLPINPALNVSPSGG